ncbi:ATP-dependent DNA helicase RecG [Chromatocurvus halotolerans]|uniref:ATP-dependent DNA helicase RecG n=1 Tax=Chromatocurvus halotolerans TaxID=1132028 RepID=UPI0023E8B927|nr:ATP-dependent DNA helicase RecG [Chromatocurvus halotolerans]
MGAARKPQTTEASVALIAHKLTELRGVGPKLASRLQDYGVHGVEDLLFHLPLRYQDRTRVTPVAALRPGQEAVVEGTIKLCDIAFGRRRSLVAVLQDGSGALLTLRFFHFNAAQRNGLQPGCRVRCFGQARPGRSGLELIHPEYRLTGDAPAPVNETLTPIYPTTEGIGQLQWRKLCGQAVALLRKNPPADLLDGVCKLDFTLVDALIYLHAPPPDAPLALLQAGEHPAQLRLALEELLAHHLSLQALRQRERRSAAPAMPVESRAVSQFLARLPFRPTGAQQRVMHEIASDLASARPMLRLVQGDVGSGKTLVAAGAALQAMAAGYQVAIMAPTEILAEQHLSSFGAWFAEDDIDIVWLSGRIKGRARQQALARIAGGHAPLIIGTHALFQDDVIFARLGLLIIDEQHRFGVHQRLQLKAKASDWRPHQLVMTATPIPRTLSMVAYADLDCSVIDELPPGRQPVTTVLVDNQRRESVIERVAHACSEGRQAYWVCTLIEESDALQAQAAEATHAELGETLPELRIGLIHGRLPATEKAAVMQQFKAGDYDLLVATTVIEVGVDVPRASLMIIENPERLGLAQLHQLRGRVGRGSTASHCVLLYQAPLSANGRERLQAMRESSDGFFIAEKDLALRGPGEVLGTRQTGLMDFRIARLPEHDHLLDHVQVAAAALQAQHPKRVAPLIQRWTGSRQVFADV